MHATRFLAFAAPLILVALVISVLLGLVPLPLALEIGMVLASLGWLFVLVKIPWDLYFAARRGRIDAEESTARGIAVAKEDHTALAVLERRLLAGALAAHVVTAAVIWLIGSLSSGAVRPSFAWLFLISAAFRPAYEGYAYLARRLAELSGRVRYPREDLLHLQAEVRMLDARLDRNERMLEAMQKETNARLEQLDVHARTFQGRHADDVVKLQKKLAELSHRFEQAVAQVSQDQALLEGVRAFARMFRQEPA